MAYWITNDVPRDGRASRPRSKAAAPAAEAPAAETASPPADPVVDSPALGEEPPKTSKTPKGEAKKAQA